MSDVRLAPVVVRLAAVLLLVFAAVPARAAADAPAISAPPDIVVGEDSGSVTLSVRLSAPSSDPVSVDFATLQSTADDGTFCTYDFAPVSGTLTFAPGQTSRDVTVQVLNCPLYVSPFKSFTLNLSKPVNATIARAGTRVSIVDDSTVVATPRLFVRDAQVDEKDGMALIPVLLGGPTGQASNSQVTVNFATHDGTATAGSDYTAGSGTLTFAPGDTVKTIAVAITDDAADEPAERFTVSLSGPSNATLADAAGTVVIGASDAAAAGQPAVLAPPDQVVGEGDGYVDLAVRLSAPGTQPVAVNYSLLQSTADDGTFCTYDFVPVTGTLNFAPGETTKFVRAEVLRCNSDNRFRSFTLNLSQPVNATIARAGTRVSITDASTVAATPRLYVRDAKVDEKDGVALVPVLLGGPGGQGSNSTVTVGYATHDGSASDGGDYTGSAGTLSFAPGQTVKTVVVPIADDGVAEPIERFTLSLTGPVNATLGDATGTVEIGASDAPPTAAPRVSAPADAVVGEVDGYIDLAVRLSAPGTDTVSVDYSAIQSTADDGTFCTYDFVPVTGTVKFAPGETTKVVRVELLNCNSPNGFRSFSFTLANAQNATIARAATRVSIVDASTVVETPKLSVRDAVVDEKDGVALVPVLLGAPPGTSSLSTVTVDYTTHDGSATAGADYTATAGTLSFAPGETVKTVVVPIADDGTDEPAENFALGLSNPSNATIAGATGTVQIGASDAAAAGAPALTAPADTIVGQGDGYVDLVVRLSAPGTQAVTVGYSTAPITAAQGNFCTYNYVGASGTLNFAPGETTKAVRVELLDCAGIPAGFETFRLTLTGPVNATIGRANAHIAIVKGGVALTGLAVTPALPGVTAGTDQQFKATGTLSTGETLDMTQAVTWASSAPGVATVSESGLAHGVTGGTSTITASFGAVSGSAELTVKGAAGQTRTQTITFGPLADRTYGDADFTVSASASSGLPVGFSASGGGCTLAGARVHIAAAGSCTITASQPGDAGTSAAPSVSRAFAIARAAQTISFGALANRTAGEPDFRVGASASSGLAVAFAASGSCTVSGATVHLTGPGSCTLTASQAGDANHAAAAAVSRTFTIAKQAPARRCKVPNVVGKTLAAAKTALTRAHCRVGKVSRAFSGKRRKGVVVAQSRRPKKVVRSGTKVDLVVSRGRKR